jgi:hypothetical protein
MEQRDNNRVMRDTIKININNARKDWVAKNFLTRRFHEVAAQPHVEAQRFENDSREMQMWKNTETVYLDKKRSTFNHVNNFEKYLNSVTLRSIE